MQEIFWKVILKLIDELYYSKYKVIFVYKDLSTKEIVKRRRKRKNEGDLVNEKKLVKETEEYREIFPKALNNLSVDAVINTTSDNPEVIEDKIKIEKDKL